MEQNREEWIKARAHAIWESGGQAHGEHDAHWLAAEKEYEARQGTAGATAATAGDLHDVDHGSAHPERAQMTPDSTSSNAVQTNRASQDDL